jgi:PKD repeat protein
MTSPASEASQILSPGGRADTRARGSTLTIVAFVVLLLAVPTMLHSAGMAQPSSPVSALPVSPTASPNGAAQLAAAEASLHAARGSAPGAAPSNASGPQWNMLNASAVAPSQRASAALAYDPLLNAVVLFGGYFVQVAAAGDTWEFANGAWTDLTPSLTLSPPGRWEAGFAFDTADGYLVLFGGRNVTQFFNDTWTFNGAAWTQLNLSAHPSARGLVGMTYDPAVNAVVLVGGGTGNLPAGTYDGWVFDNDTWEFAGGAWTNLTSSLSASPPAASGFGLAFDPNGNNLLLLGGSTQPNQCSLISQQWVLGPGLTGWVNQTGLVAVPYGLAGFAQGGVVYDPNWGGIVAFGGLNDVAGSCVSTDQTWYYDGNVWTNITGFFNGTSPPANNWFPMTYDPAASSMMVFGGNLQGTFVYSNSTWMLSGNLSYEARIVATPSQGAPPLAVQFTPAVTDAVGTYSTFWQFGDGNTSTSLNASQTYTALGSYVVTLSVLDSLGQYANASTTVVVTYPSNSSFTVAASASPSQGPAPLNVSFNWSGTGGFAPYAVNWTFGDGNYSTLSAPTHLYLWNGTYTVNLTVTDASGATDSASLAVDVGGAAPVGWWSQVSSAANPSTRSAPAMAYDPQIGVVILFGGYLGPAVATSADTWEYSNGSWTNLSSSLSVAPPARWEAGFAYDPSSASLILFGGRNLTQFFNDTWSFNVSGWTQLFPTQSPSARGLVGMTYDVGQAAIVLYGGGTGNVPAQSLSAWNLFDDTWEFSGGNWHNVTAGSTLSPPAVASAGLVYDPIGGYDLLYGGTTAPNGCAPVAEEWEFQNGSWSNHTSSVVTGPGGTTGVYDFGITYDVAGSGLLFFGGVTTTSSGACYSTAETWGYGSNATWTNLTGAVGAPAPVDRHAFAMTYDAADGYAMLFGGNTYNSYTYLDDTWVFLASGVALAPIPASVAVVNSVGLGPLQVTFQVLLGTGFEGTSYDWTFGDGSSMPGGPTISHVYSTVGLYQPSVRVTVVGGRATTLQLPVVHVLAAALGPGGGPTPSATPMFGWQDVLGAAAGLIGGLALWVMLDARQRRLRREGIDLVHGAEAPPPPPVA